MSDVIKFEFDQPVEVALRYLDGKIYPSSFPGGDDRHMFSTTDGRVMYVSPLTDARIKALGVQIGEVFYIVKRKNGRLTEFEVFRDSEAPAIPPQPAPAPAPVPQRMGIVNFGAKKTFTPTSKLAERLVENVNARNAAAANEAPSQLEQQLADSITLVQTRKTAARAQTASAQPAWVDTLIGQTNHLVDAFAASLTHASRHGISVKPEDVRSLLVTSFIQLSQKANRNAA